MYKSLTSHSYGALCCNCSDIIPIGSCKTIYWSDQSAIVHAKDKTANYGYCKIDTCWRVYFYWHQWHVMASAGISCNVVRIAKGTANFLCCWKVLLCPDDA